MGAKEFGALVARMVSLERTVHDMKIIQREKLAEMEDSVRQAMARMEAFAPEIEQPPISPPPFPECLRMIGCQDPNDGV